MSEPGNGDQIPKPESQRSVPHEYYDQFEDENSGLQILEDLVWRGNFLKLHQRGPGLDDLLQKHLKDKKINVGLMGSATPRNAATLGELLKRNGLDREGNQILILDHNPEAIRRHYQRLPPPGQFLSRMNLSLGDIRHSEFSDNSADLLIYDYTMDFNARTDGNADEAYRDLESSISGLSRVLKDDGVAIVGAIVESDEGSPRDGDGLHGRRFAWKRYEELFRKNGLEFEILFAGPMPEDQRAVKDIPEQNTVLFLHKTEARKAWRRIYKEYFAPWGLLGGIDTYKRIRSGKRILDVNTQHNDLAIALADSAKQDPSKFGAFVMGTNRNMVAGPNDPNFKQLDVRHLDFPEGFEGFDTIVSDGGFPADVLKWLDKDKKDAADMRGAYDFNKPIDAPISSEEAVAQLEQGFSELLRWVKPDGRIRLDPPATWDPQTKSYKDLDIVETALSNLKTRYHNQYPHFRWRITDMGLLIGIDQPKDKKPEEEAE
ncbi:class I SAM-dependent methyltransferase [Candidatus Kaiserbacteria bacterium]|nr:class I SAM-dependent methyltransferase [Candidatus Kaiserbacteria bacterium]